MVRSLILPRAEQDIALIFEYHLDHSDRTAKRFVDAVVAVVRRLEQFPESGSPRRDLGADIRFVAVTEYRVNLYYHVAEGEETVVTILRVLRQERDVSEDDVPGGG